MGNTANLRPPWQKGQSGNPNGRPKRKTFLELVLEKIGDDETEYIEVFLSMLRQAQPFFWKEYLERRDGKVKDEVLVEDRSTATFVMRSRNGADGGSDTSSSAGPAN